MEEHPFICKPHPRHPTNSFQRNAICPAAQFMFGFRAQGHAVALLFPMLFVFALLAASQAQGRIFIVTDTNDTLKATSLRGAIIAANGFSGHNIIILKQGTYQLTIPGANESESHTGDLDITRGELEIRGVDVRVTITAAGLGNRSFHIWPGAKVIFENLTLTGGSKPYPDGSGGGGILNDGTLILENCNVSGNSILVGCGGGIYNTGKLTLTRCIISENSTGDGPGNDGGGIYNSDTGALELDAWTISNNTCDNGNAFGIVLIPKGGSGGGLYNAGAATLNNCAVSGNICGTGAVFDTGGSGGGIFNSGELTMKNCSIDGNLAGAGGYNTGDGGNGGGIYSTGAFTSSNCTISSNSAGLGGSVASNGDTGGTGGSGGGIYSVGSFSLACCTISGNSAGSGGSGGQYGNVTGNGGIGGNGGGIYNAGNFLLTACTITDNSGGSGGSGGMAPPSVTDGGNGGSGGIGGGIFNAASAVTAGMRNALIALNFVGAGGAGGPNLYFMPGRLPGTPGLQGTGPDLAGAFTSGGFNLVGEADGSVGFTKGVDADQVGTTAAPINPLIGPLEMNGGFTATHALLWGSPGIDQGNSFGIHTDQRGHHRPHDYAHIPNAPGGDGSDIGAFEMDRPQAEFHSRPSEVP